MKNFSLSPCPVPIAFISLVFAACVFSAAAGQSKLPMQRFGGSEFRLTAKGSIDRSFGFSPDGKMIAGANWEELRLWSFPDGKLLHDFSGAVQTNCIGFAADGHELLAFETRRMEFYRFDVPTGKLIARVPLDDVVNEQGATSFRLSSNGRWLYMTGAGLLSCHHAASSRVVSVEFVGW